MGDWKSCPQLHTSEYGTLRAWTTEPVAGTYCGMQLIPPVGL